MAFFYRVMLATWSMEHGRVRGATGRDEGRGVTPGARRGGGRAHVARVRVHGTPFLHTTSPLSRKYVNPHHGSGCGVRRSVGAWLLNSSRTYTELFRRNGLTELTEQGVPGGMLPAGASAGGGGAGRGSAAHVVGCLARHL